MSIVLDADFSFSAEAGTFTNETGDYSAENTGGYGSPNDAFNLFAHYAIVRKKNVNDVDDVVLTLESYDPLTAEAFTFERTLDGWYEGALLDIRIWTAGTYPSGTVRSYGGVIYEANQSTSGVPGVSAHWDVVSDLEDIEDNSTVSKKIVGRCTAYNADVYWSTQIATNSQRGRCGIAADERTKKRLDDIYFHIQAILVADQLGNNEDGEWNALALNALGAR